MRLSCCIAALVAVLVALAGSGCGFNSSPADQLEFRPPQGWRASPGILGMMQFWRSPGNDREMLMLMRSPKPLNANDVFANSQVNDSVKGATIESRRSIFICGHQPATLVEALGTSQNGEHERVDILVTNISGQTYFAMYARPVATASNPAAQAALRELCPKP